MYLSFIYNLYDPNISASLPEFMSDDSTNKVRIVGGSNATAPIPWQVNILDTNRTETNGNTTIKLKPVHRCGGTIIDKRTILTAAHCFIIRTRPDDNDRHLNTTVTLFALSVGIVKEDQSDNILITPESITIHEKYECGSHDDIAIIKLEEPLSFNENVGPACLPKKLYDPKAGTECFISGWGSEEQEIPGENDSG